MEKTYSMKKFANYENYCKLIEAIGNAEPEDRIEDGDSVKKAVESFLNYVSEVDMGETRIKIAYTRYEDSDLRELIQTYDQSRRIAHEAAIAYASMLNKMARIYGVGLIFEGDTKERYEVADFCLEMTNEIFEHRKK